MVKVLLVGSGAREHALGWRLARDQEVSEVFYAPGNAGTEQEPNAHTIRFDATLPRNFSSLFDLINAEKIDLTIIGPEAPLADGVVDYLNQRGYDQVFGPTKAAMALEADKFFSWKVMNTLSIPQAYSILCSGEEEAIQAIHGIPARGIVLKARGLTNGKGVTVCGSKDLAYNALENHIRQFGSELIVAERLYGQEFSVFAISDGSRVVPLELSLQDHKTVYDNDKGPNTGGMGAYGPAPIASIKVVRHVAESMMTPIIQKMRNDGIPCKGFLYGGLMMTRDGPKVLEFNCRFGDPECQPAMMLIKGNLYRALSASLEENLNNVDIPIRSGAACCVVMASQGYPGVYPKGVPIVGLEDVEKMPFVKVFHAGTTLDKDGVIKTSGGRVLSVTAYAQEGIREAREFAYMAVARINNDHTLHYRKDIAQRALTKSYRYNYF